MSSELAETGHHLAITDTVRYYRDEAPALRVRWWTGTIFPTAPQWSYLMSRLTKAIVYGIATGLIATVVTIVIVGFLDNWANTSRPTFVREELAWFGVISIITGLNTWYSSKGSARPI